MPQDSERIRLPELPVFKKYSLALRQEFASVDEILSVLDRTATKVRDTLERAEEERRRQEQARSIPGPEDIDDQLEDEGEDDSAYPLDQVDDPERPFWEEPGGQESVSPKSRVPAPNVTPKKRVKPKAKKAKPSVVQVGHQGKPIISKKAPAKRTPVRKPTAKKAPVGKPTAKKAPVRAKSKPKPRSRAGSRRR